VETYVQAGLEALGDPTRFAIFQRLVRQPQAVSRVAAGLPVSRPAVSQHLKVLKNARLVTDRKAGTRRIYEVNREGIALLRNHFDQLWEQTLNAFKFAVEQDQKTEEEKTHGRSNAGKRKRGKKDHKG
jgi:DNA-binding transcriptional ArsR family regulator